MRSFISSNRFLITICLLVSFVCAAAWIYITEPTYRSTAIVQIETSNGNVDVTSVVEQLTSETFIAEAVKDKGMNVLYSMNTDLRDFSATYTSPYKVAFRTESKNFFERNYNIELFGEREYKITRDEYGISRTTRGTFGEEIEDRGVYITVTLKEKSTTVSSLFYGPTYSFTILSDHALATRIKKGPNNITAEANGPVIHLACENNSSLHAKYIIDALIGHYNEKQKIASDGTLLTSVAHIDTQLQAVGKELDATENEIAEFKKGHGMVDLTKSSEAVLNELKALEMQKVELDLQMAALDNISIYLRKNRTINNSMVDYGTITDPLFTQNISELSALYREKEMTASAGGGTAEIESQIELLKESISESVLNTRKKTHIKKEEILNAIARTRRSMRSLPEVERQLASMERKLDMNQALYDKLIAKRADAIIHTTIPASGLTVIQPSMTPANPWAPSVPKTTGISAGMGLLLAILAGLFRGKRPVKLKTRIDLESETDIPFIGNISQDEDKRRRSAFADICTRLLMQRGENNCQVMTITSTMTGEGKTYVATNLARQMAAIDKKVLLIDMNTQSQDLEGEFNIKVDHTLADSLDGRIDVHEAIGITAIPNLEVISAGELKAGINTLLASRDTKNILGKLREHYDYIIIDTPEAGTFIDAVPLMKMSDTSLYVMKANDRSDSQLRNAEIIRNDYGIDDMYIVLNSARSASSHTGMTTTKGQKKVKDDQSVEIDGEKVSFLRRVALWFY
jgi:capsular exopolysaccharide synthesis family protein